MRTWARQDAIDVDGKQLLPRIALCHAFDKVGLALWCLDIEVSLGELDDISLIAKVLHDGRDIYSAITWHTHHSQRLRHIGLVAFDTLLQYAVEMDRLSHLRQLGRGSRSISYFGSQCI